MRGGGANAGTEGAGSVPQCFSPEHTPADAHASTGNLPRPAPLKCASYYPAALTCRARPEVMTIGIKTVRELCTRCPLVMTPELLQVRQGVAGPGLQSGARLLRQWCWLMWCWFGTESQSRQGTFFPVSCGRSASTPPAVCFPCSQDLTAYKKFRNKEVSSSARSLIGLFRCACMPVYTHVWVPVHACMLARQSWVQAGRLPTVCRIPAGTPGSTLAGQHNPSSQGAGTGHA